MKWLAFIFGESFYKLNSFFVKQILKLKGVTVGSGFYIQGVPKLKIRGKSSNVIIGRNVRVLGDIDIRNRENGTILIEDDVALDDNCRLVAANSAVLKIGKGTRIGLCTVFNCGESVTVGERVLISGFCYIQSSNHGTKRNGFIQDQAHTYGKISIGTGAWLGSHVTLLPGVEIGDGAILGAKSVVSKSVPSFMIFGGVPAKQIGIRE